MNEDQVLRLSKTIAMLCKGKNADVIELALIECLSRVIQECNNTLEKRLKLCEEAKEIMVKNIKGWSAN
jgi:hypothetical protein